jgi:hypothetical protein
VPYDFSLSVSQQRSKQASKSLRSLISTAVTDVLTGTNTETHIQSDGNASPLETVIDENEYFEDDRLSVAAADEDNDNSMNVSSHDITATDEHSADTYNIQRYGIVCYAFLMQTISLDLSYMDTTIDLFLELHSQS